MDAPIRSKLLLALAAVALTGGILMVAAGSFLINGMVVQEAQRRVTLGLKTAQAMLDRRLEEAQTVSSVVADWVGHQKSLVADGVSEPFLGKLREKAGFDYLHIVGQDGVIVATARGDARGRAVADSPVVQAALKQGRAASGLRVMDLPELAADDASLASRAYLEVLPTPRAKPGGPMELRQALVMEAAAPVIKPPGQVVGVVQVGVLLNRNFDFVDTVRDNIFTIATYKNKNLGTVTIFLGDVRIATNVIGPNGERAIGTRVSAEVNDRVLGQGDTWIGPAFVVSDWYMSAYQPLLDANSKIVGILYVGVLKERYDDMQRKAWGIFLLMTLLALAVGMMVATFLAGRIARPVVKLTQAALEIERGNLDHRLPEPARAERDELKRLISAFNRMAQGLKDRTEELQRSHEQLERAAGELQRWNQNYLDTLEFITHELKNQVAAMKINLLAVRDGYVGDLSGDQKDALDDVVTAVNRTEEMILNYLNLSRIEKGELEVRARPVQVEADVVQPVLREVRARLDERGMRVELDLPEDLVVQADPSLLQTVYENLLSNAAKYGVEGGLVRVWGARRDGWIELHVWNEGPGIPQDQLDELFRKFSRLPASGQQARGTGLGLFITREIVRKHGGDIRAESEEGHWIDFVFTLPRPDVVLGEEGE
jgi:two-component system NtrC family sensor kinase